MRQTHIHKKINIRTSNRGSILVEIIVGAAILSVVSLTFLGTFAFLSRLHQRDMLIIKGDLLAEEGLEAVRYIRSTGWFELSSLVGATRYIELGTSSWGITTTPEIIDGVFSRTLKIYSVERDISQDIVSSGGIVDPDTLLAEVTVSWEWRGTTSSVTYKTYVTNI